MANREACELWIEQEIESSLEEGKTPYSIGKELSEMVERLFETKINPKTISKRAERTLATNVASDLTIEDDSEKEDKQDKQVIRDDGGRFVKGTPQQPGPGRPAKNPHVSYNTGESEWYTPREYIEAARVVLGGKIDIDPASTALANEIVQAETFYTKENSGLDKHWSGKVWMNPPYASDLIKQFCTKFALHVSQGNIECGIALVNNATETVWFRELVDCANAIVFTSGRVRFLDPQGNPGAPLQGQALIYFGERARAFIFEFRKFGWGALLNE